jgi:uncharacterized delta-60 repeat protein
VEALPTGGGPPALVAEGSDLPDVTTGTLASGEVARVRIAPSAGALTWTVEAPNDGTSRGARILLEERHWFRKQTTDASLELALGKLALEICDDLAAEPTCAWGLGFAPLCFDESSVAFLVQASWRTASGEHQQIAGLTRLAGWPGHWDPDVFGGVGTPVPWDETALAVSDDVDGDGGQRHVRVAAELPSLRFDLSLVPVGQELTVVVVLEVVVRARPGAVHAALELAGVESAWRLTGLAGSPPLPVEEGAPSTPAAGCDRLEPGGTFHLDAATYLGTERAFAVQPIVVERRGGSAGRASVRLSTTPMTASSDVDFTPVSEILTFEDGDSLACVIWVPLTEDSLIEGDETFVVALSDASGCGALGTPASARFTLFDDEDPAETYFTLGGTVVDLVGPGLVLSAFGQRHPIDQAGSFTLPGRYSTGTMYVLAIASHPTGQLCSLVNPSGEIGRANVTDVLVTCTSAPIESGLDPTFGQGGKVTGGAPVAGLAVQADDKLVTVGTRTVSRYLPNGTLDPELGTAGRVTLSFGGTDDLYDVALQDDGKIVVVGVSSGDFAVARLLSDGGLDPAFDGDGMVTTDFAGRFDQANAVRVGADGTIVVAGNAQSLVGGAADNDFAVARYLPGGALDPAFSEDGKVMTNVAGRSDLGKAMVLGADGTVIVGGRVAPGGVDNPDFGVVRYTTAGTLDPSFGSDGILRDAVSGTAWDEVTDLAIQPDGKLVAAGLVDIANVNHFGVVRWTVAGARDPAFGVDGRVALRLSASNDDAYGLALQPDGRLVLAGMGANGTNVVDPDFLVVRLLPDGALDETFAEAGVLRSTSSVPETLPRRSRFRRTAASSWPAPCETARSTRPGSSGPADPRPL